MSTPQENARQNAQRFDELLRARMAEVDLPTFQDVADVADITVETLGVLRRGGNKSGKPSLKVAMRIDKAMRWRAAPSSTLAIFEGGDPDPLPLAPPRAEVKKYVDPLEERIKALSHLPQAKKDAIIRRMRADRKAALEEAEALDELEKLRTVTPKGRAASA